LTDFFVSVKRKYEIQIFSNPDHSASGHHNLHSKYGSGKISNLFLADQTIAHNPVSHFADHWFHCRLYHSQTASTQTHSTTGNEK